MAQTHDVEILLGDSATRLGAWDELEITQDMLAPTSPWTATLWRTATLAPWPETEIWTRTKLYTPASVTVDEAVQLRGFVESCVVSADRSGSPLTITGRDQVGIAMVADADPALSLRDTTLAEALTALFAPLGITLTIGALAEDARAVQAGLRPGARTRSTRKARRAHHVDRFRVKVGEKVWQLASQLCRRHGYLLYTAPSGAGVGLVIDRPRYDDAPLYAFTRRRQPDGSYAGTILSAKRTLDGSQTPTAVTVFGHSAHAASQDARHRATVRNEQLLFHNRVADFVTSRPRYLRDPKARTPQVAEQRARREIATAMAAFDVTELTTQGFGQDGHLFAVNTMARIDDDMTDIHGQGLITRVSMKRSRSGGHVSTVRLVPRDAIIVEPDPEV